MGPYAFKGFADMGNSFLKSYQGELERKKLEERQAREDAWKDEVRGRERQAWQKSDEFDRVLQEEYAPVEPVPDYTAQGEGPLRGMSVRGQQFDDAPQAEAAAAQANTPMSRATRAADRGMAIDPSRATKLRNDAITSRAAEMQLTAAEKKQADEVYNQQVLGMLSAAPTWWQGAAKMGEVVLAGNGTAGFELSPDNKTVSLFMTDAEGNRKDAGSFPANEQGRQMYVNATLKLPAETKMLYLQAQANAEREAEDRQTQRDEKREDFDYELGARAKSAISIYNATTGARPRGEDPAALTKKIEAIETAIGRKLTEPEKMAAIGIRGERPETTKSLGDGLIQRGDQVFAIDPATGQPKVVNFGPTPLELAIKKFQEGKQDGRPSATAATGTLVPFSKQDVQRGSQVDPSTLERRSERSMFGGQPTYFYFDPATGKKYSVDEYNQLGR